MRAKDDGSDFEIGDVLVGEVGDDFFGNPLNDLQRVADFMDILERKEAAFQCFPEVVGYGRQVNSLFGRQFAECRLANTSVEVRVQFLAVMWRGTVFFMQKQCLYSWESSFTFSCDMSLMLF